MIKLYNSASKKLEVLQKKDLLTIYSCGPTVHDYAHIGNMRTFLFEDLLIRTLKSFKYNISHVRNITDIDDKIIQKIQETNLSLSTFTQLYTNEFLTDLKNLEFDLSTTIHVKATDYIVTMTHLIETLIHKDYAYESGDGVYFKINAFKQYGNFAGLDLANLKNSTSSNNAEFSKDDFGDFVLWKKYKLSDGNISWTSPWGKGRPGWHTECAAIIQKNFPQGVDIHTGGIDLLFPHHTNEKAHYECLTHKPMAKFWIHAAHLLVNNKKMSKTTGNFYTIKDLQNQGFSNRTIRFYLQTGAHYRTPLNFTLEGLHGAQSALKRIDNFIYELTKNPDLISIPYNLKNKFDVHLMEDLNISGAISEIFQIINLYYDGQKFNTEKLLDDLHSINLILNVFSFAKQLSFSPKIEDLLLLRDEARKTKNWAEADRLRNELLINGIQVRDTNEGTDIFQI